MKRSLFVLFLFNLSYFTVLAQEVPQIHNYLSIDYNGDQQNWSITQDCNELLYTANSDGILIYNGLKWQLVRVPHNHIPRTLYKGSDCKIYVAGYEFFGAINAEKRDSVFYEDIGGSLLKDTNEEFWNIFGNEEQIIFQSFSDVYLYDYESISKLSPPGNVMLGTSVDQNLWLPKIENGLYRIIGNQISEEKISEQLPIKSKVVGIVKGENSNELLIATQYNGIFRWFNNKIQPYKTTLDDELKQVQINKFLKSNSGYYIIGTILNGLYYGKDLKAEIKNINKSNGLNNNTVLSLFEDKNQDLWVGLDRGISQIKLNEAYRYFYDKPGQLGNIFCSIQHEGRFYLGSNQGLFLQRTDGKFDLLKGSQGQVWTLTEIDGQLFCGHNTGTFLVQNRNLIPVSELSGGWSSISIDSQRILHSTYIGLTLLEKDGTAWKVKERLRNGDILIQEFELQDHSLVGYHPHYGICILELSRDYGEVLETRYINSIEGDEVSSSCRILKVDKHILLIDEGGIFRWNGETFLRVQETELDNYFLNNDFKEEMQYISELKKLTALENLSESRFQSPNQRANDFLVGFESGYITIPKQDKLVTRESHIEIDYITFQNNLYTQNFPSPLVLEPGVNDLNIQFKNQSFRKQLSSTTFKLDNWNEEWHELPEDGLISFYNLQDGKYTLYLNKDHQEKHLSIEVKPYWYESGYGYALYFCIGCILLFFINLRNKKRLRSQKKKLEEKRMRALESERIRAANEKLHREVAFKNKMLANSTMNLVQKNKMLIDLKTKISKSKNEDSYNQNRQQIIHLINKNINSNQDWELFEKTFAQVHEDFLNKLKAYHPNITAGEIRLAAYIKMNLSSKEIAPLLNISIRSIENKRYRLRKKLEIGHENNLKEYLQSL